MKGLYNYFIPENMMDIFLLGFELNLHLNCIISFNKYIVISDWNVDQRITWNIIQK